MIPTLSDLYNSILTDLESELGVIIPAFGKNYLRAKAAVQAAKLKLYYLAIGKIQKNIFVDTAEPESMGGTLERFGRVKLGRNPFGATAGEYTLTITGSLGAIIKRSTTFKSDDSAMNPGKLFVLDADYTMPGTTGTITVRALEAGLDSRLKVGNTLTATAPIALVNKTATVASESVEPLAAEDLEEYRRKSLDAYRQEPQGGADTDYRLWAADAAGVRLVYPYAKSGYPNEINLFVEANADDSLDGKGTPSSAILDAVEDVIELDPDTTKPLNQRGRRPLTVFQVHYLPITIKSIDIEITGYVGHSAEIGLANYNALKAAFEDIRPFIAGADSEDNRNDYLDVNKIISVLLETRPGAKFTSVDLKIDGVSVPSYTFENGDIPSLNTTTYIS